MSNAPADDHPRRGNRGNWGDWVDRIHLAKSFPSEHDGKPAWSKTRGAHVRLAMRAANIFFAIVSNPVRAVAAHREWLEWESLNFTLLHGPQYQARVSSGVLHMDCLPGFCLSRKLDVGTLQPSMLAAAARELHRAHQLRCSFHNGPWSHGDCHSGNILIDPADNRARLIDFEVRHLQGMPAHERHADDLLILLQDVCGRCTRQDWPALASAILEDYQPGQDIRAALERRLVAPCNPFKRLWWAVRTTWMPRMELKSRLETVRKILAA